MDKNFYYEDVDEEKKVKWESHQAKRACNTLWWDEL
jgi:hypothetical protein